VNLHKLISTLTLVLLFPVAQAADGNRGPVADQDTPPRFAPRAEVYPQQRGNLQLSSVLAPGADPYPGTQFTVLREDPDAFGKTRFAIMAAAGPHDHAAFELSPGRYLVQARNGAVTIEQAVQVPVSGVLVSQLVLNAGELHLGAFMDEAGVAADQAWFRVLREDTDSYGRPVRIQMAGNGYAQTASFVLPAGDYVAEASYGNARAETRVQVAAGAIVTRELVLHAGRLELSSKLADGAQNLGQTRYTVYRKGGDRAADWTEVASADHADRIGFILPSGEYRVSAQRDQAVAEATVTLSAGETSSVELPLNAGELFVYAMLTGQGDTLLDTWFKVEPQGRAAALPLSSENNARGPAHSAHFVLPGGQYRVTASVGESAGVAEVEIEPGGTQNLAISLDAARVTLSLIAGPGLGAYAYTWFSVYRVEQDAHGAQSRRRVFNAGYYPETEVVLPAGDYLAFARSDEHRGETAFSVQPGQIMRVAIVSER